ncbi:putative transcription factor B3-Domain family [Helianthus annuus]|nr:putative transcription factor B3-Domain family [Helianthus annuus]
MHVENKITNSPIIRSANGGYSWRLKIEQNGDGYCFVNGWNNVVEDIQLGFGDFLFFRLVDGSTFRMSIYSPDGCEKILQPKSDESCHEKNEEKEKSDDHDDDPFFVAIVTLTHARYLVTDFTYFCSLFCILNDKRYIHYYSFSTLFFLMLLVFFNSKGYIY